MTTRRSLLLSPLLLALPTQATDALAALEARSGGRLGVAMLDTATGAISGHRLDERFGLCSTFKLALAAWVLAAVDAGRIRPDLWVRYGEADLLSHAPVTRAQLSAGGMTAMALAEATQTTSDNPAANLLLRELGGPAAFTAWLRSQGDAHTRLDRLEP
jgi:beta-lactamase class A